MDFLLWLQGVRTPAVEGFFLVFTHLGDQIAVVAVLCLFLWCIDREFAIRLALVFFLGGIANQFLKLVFAVPRPWLLDARILPVEQAMASATGWSFPSGHTASAVALFGGLFLYAKKWPQRIACVLAVLLVALSRLVLGVHTPADVFVSLAVGIALLAIAWFALERANGGRYVMIGSCVLVAALLAAVLFRTRANGWGEEIHDALYAAGAAVGFLAGWWLSRGEKEEGATQSPLLLIGKYALGLLGVVAIKLCTGFHWAVETLGYALLAFWAVALYPALWKRWMKRRGEKHHGE